MNKLPHIGVYPEQISENVILCGDPARAERIASLLENGVFLAENREYRLFKGVFRQKEITVCSCGIGAPSLVIALEELCQAGAKQVVRVGSSGALQPNIAIGDLIIAQGAVRDEGASQAYINASYPAFADFELVNLMKCYLSEKNFTHHLGLVRSHDSFYRDDEMEICQYWHTKGILGADMETSALFTIGRLRKMKTAAILNNVVLFEQDVQDGVSQYASSENDQMQGEQMASLAAIYALSE